MEELGRETLDALRAMLNKRVDDLRRELLQLREADQEAIRVALAGYIERFQGFPQQYATKPDMDAVKSILQELKEGALTREIYDTNHKALQQLLHKLDTEKMSESEFVAFRDQQIRQREEDAIERRAIAQGLATTAARGETEKELKQERTTTQAATFGQIDVIVGIFGFVMSTIVVVANIVFQ
jgi:hypothetical protein